MVDLSILVANNEYVYLFYPINNKIKEPNKMFIIISLFLFQFKRFKILYKLFHQQQQNIREMIQ